MWVRVLAAEADDDIIGILAWTDTNLGTVAGDRYAALIRRALRDIMEDPFRSGSLDRADIGDGIRSYHLRFSRGTAAGSVKQPRHFLLYRITGPKVIHIGRVLHDSMDLFRHLPEEYREE